MTELANYIVTHVRHGAEPGKISHVRLLERQDEQFEDRDLMERAELIELLEDEQRVFTWDYDNEELGLEIELVRVEGEHFVRLDGERYRADNLGELPEV